MALKFNPTTGFLDWDSGSTGGGGSGDMLKATYDAASVNEQLVGLTATQTLTNKTLTSPIVSGLSGTTSNFQAFGNITIKSTYSLLLEGSTSGTTTLRASAIAGTTTLTLPAATDTLVGQSTTDTLTNKTLASNTIATTQTQGDNSTKVATTAYADAPNNVVNKIGSLTSLSHSYGAGTTQGDSGTSNVMQESYFAKLQGLLGIHEINTINLAQAASRITSPTNPITGDAFAGWAAALQYILPNNNTNINAASDIVVSDPVVAVNGANVVVHGVNDFNVGYSGTAADDNQRATNVQNAASHGYRSVFSRMRMGAVFSSSTNAGSITWDSTIAFGGTWADNASVTKNSGSAYKSTTDTSTPATVTISIPTNVPPVFTVGVTWIADASGVNHLTAGYAASGAISPAVAANSDFPSSGTLVIKNVRTGEEMLVTAGLGSNTWTVTSGNRGVNGTSAAAGLTSDVITVAPDAHKVTYSGTVANSTGTSSLSGQGFANQQIAITKRIACTSADAGKTIIATAGNIITGDTSASIKFDSWGIEATNPPPIVVTNLHHWEYGNTIFYTSAKIAGWNTALNAVIAEFDSWVALADVYTPFFNRNSTITASMPASGDSGTSTAVTATTLTNTSKGYATNALVGATVTSGGVTMTVTSNTATVITGSGGWSGATPATGSYTVSGTAASIGITANSSTFTPTVGMRMSFGALVTEYLDITAVSGSAPNWKLGVTRAAGGSTAVAHTSGINIMPMAYMHTDQIHLSVQGHAVYAETIYQAFKSMPTPSTYQMAENQGNWSQYSQSFSMGIIDNYYMYPAVNVMATAAQTINKMMSHPIYIPKTCNIVEIGQACTAVNASPCNFRYGIYLPDSTRSRPGKLLQEFGTVVSSAVVNAGLTGTYQILRPGWYWLAVVQQGGGGVSTVRTISTLGLSTPAIMSDAPLAAVGMVGFSQTGVSGALPNAWTIPAGTETAGVPRIHVRLRSVQFA